MILPKWPYFSEDEIEAAEKVLQSGKVNYWTGEECKFFEKEFADFVGVPYAVSLANGTLALELALYALNIGPGDDVIVPARTFIATASSVVARGAKPIIADVDPISQNVTVETISAVKTSNTKAIIVVHLAGWPCEMDKILDFARANNLKIIEDCAQAHGAKFKEKYVGSFGDAAAFSFCQDKIMTTAGEGGMFVTNDKDLWKRAWAYKDHGKSYDKAFSSASHAGFRWLHQSFGSNFRMTEVQAAIGRSQLNKLPEWISIRRRNANLFSSYFRENTKAFRLTIPENYIEHAYYKYYTFLDSKCIKSSWNRDRILQELNNKGVPCGSGSCGEIYLEEAFQKMNLQPAQRLQVAKELSETSLMFLVHPTLNKNHIEYMCSLIKEVLQSAER